MANRNYWQKRMKALENQSYESAVQCYQDIQEEYRKAINNLQMDIMKWYQRLADNNDISYAAAKKFLKTSDLEEFKWTVEQYIKAGEENAIDQRWMKQLENASCKYHISYLEAMKLQAQQHAELLLSELENGMTEHLHKTYSDQFYRSAYEIAKGTGVGSNLAALGTDKIELVLQKPWARDGKNFSDRIWNNKEKLINNLHTDLTQSIIRGEDPQKAISQLDRDMNVSRSQAGNLIMTETAAISAAAQKDCFKELDVEEFEVVETLDGSTCEICQDMDGKHFPMSDYRIGETAPPFHPRCRGCTCPYFDDEFTEGQRAARDEDGEVYYVPEDMTYKEWKETYVQDAGQEELTPLAQGEKSEYTERTQEELETAARSIKNDLPSYADLPSKWSGHINVFDSFEDVGTLAEKDWTCDINTLATVDDGTILHELLHSCSASYYSPDVYSEHQAIEEASVEFLKQQICKERSIVNVMAYDPQVTILQLLNNSFDYGSDLGFSKELFNISLPERYQWLEDKVDQSLRDAGASFEDYNEVMEFVEKLKGRLND